MNILASLAARWLIHAGAVEMTFTILLCYTLAVSFGHVKPWLPTISACGEHPPEQYFFRFGIFLGAMLIEVEAIALYIAKKSSKLTFVLGAVAAFCLGVVAVVAANENDIVHTTAAVIFFVFEDIMSVLLTIDLLGSITRCSLGIKIASSSVACISTLLRLLLTMDYFSVNDFPLLPVVEWSNTAAIVVFQLSLATDIHSLFISITESTSDQSGSDSVKTPLDQQQELVMLGNAGPLPSKKQVIVEFEPTDTN